MKDTDDIAAMMADIGRRARAASAELAFATSDRKHAALIGAAGCSPAQQQAQSHGHANQVQGDGE